MFTRCFGADRVPGSLSRRDWDRFIVARRRGVVRPKGSNHQRQRVRDRVIAYDLRHLLAVVNWAIVAGDGLGSVLLDRNPLKGFPLPREESPLRPVLIAEQYAKLRTAARDRGAAAEALLVLCHETGHRIGAVRQLRWIDIELTAGKGRVRWRAELDKIGYEHSTPITDDVVALLVALRTSQGVIGDTPVFPMPNDPTACYTRPSSARRGTRWRQRQSCLRAGGSAGTRSAGNSRQSSRRCRSRICVRWAAGRARPPFSPAIRPRTTPRNGARWHSDRRSALVACRAELSPPIVPTSPSAQTQNRVSATDGVRFELTRAFRPHTLSRRAP